MQTLIFSRQLLSDAEEKGALDQLDEMFKALNKKGIKVTFITQKKWDMPSQLNSLKSDVKIFHTSNRRNRSIATKILEHVDGDIKTSIVLASCDTDIIMGANSSMVCVSAGWVDDLEKKPSDNVLKAKHITTVPKIFDLINGESPWYSVLNEDSFSLYAMINAGDFGNIEELKPLVANLQNELKEGVGTSNQLMKFFLASSIMKTEELKDAKYIGIYPSSQSIDFKDELMFKYFEVVRYMLKKGPNLNPLLIRHKVSPKRHKGEGGDRNDPNPQLNSLIVNPYYKNRLKGETVIIMDDYVTNGTSFRVAEALLKKAGAGKVICIAMGKWGKRMHSYDIDLSNRDPFEKVEESVEFNATLEDKSSRNVNALNEILEKYKSI